MQRIIALAGFALACALAGCGGGPPVTPEPVWQTLLEGLPGALLRVYGTGPRDVYAVGADADGQGSLVYHFDGDRVRRLEPGTRGDLWWLHPVSEDDLRMVGEDGLILQYQPSTGRFTRLSAPSSEDTLFGVWASRPDDVWYVGGAPAATRSVAWRDTGAGAEAVSDLPVSTSSTTIFKAHRAPGGSLWMVGQRGRTWRLQGDRWTEPESGTTETLFTVHGHTGDRVYAVGGTLRGVILAFDGERWVDETPAGAAGINGVHAVNESEAYAAGFNGTVWKRASSGTWSAFSPAPPTFEDLHAVWVDADGAIWVVGGLLSADPPTRGVLARYGSPLDPSDF